jgi:hypothetical protein
VTASEQAGVTRWEQAPGFDAWVATCRDVLLAPGATFHATPGRRGGAPLGFWAIGVGALALGTLVRLNAFPLLPGRMGAGWDPTNIVVIALLLSPVALVVVHLTLLLFGCGGGGFSATMRVLAFVHGSGAPFAVVPLVGLAVAAFACLVVLPIALAGTHQAAVSRVAVAMLLLIASCGGASLYLLSLAMGPFAGH